MISIVFILWVPAVITWGRLGHQLVADVAQYNAEIDVVATWGLNGSLASIANWPDEIRRYTHKYDRLHYVNVKNGTCSYDEVRDCKKQKCVVGAVEKYAQQLENATDLSFLTHFVGDLHQPLHVTDKLHIGNAIDVYFGHKMTFHSLWDTGLLMHALHKKYRGDVSAYRRILQEKSTLLQINETKIAVWANETAKLSCNVSIWQGIKNNVTISESYYTTAIEIIEQQIMVAGKRLAQLIDRSRPSRVSHVYSFSFV